MEYSVLVRPELLEDYEKQLTKEAGKAKRLKVPSDIKLALYRQENYRRRLLKEKGSEIKVRQKANKSMTTQEVQTGLNPIVATLPKSLQSKGEGLLDFVQKIPDFVVNEKGEISYSGTHVPGSRIFDLVHDFVRDRPSKSPAKGWQTLAEALKEHNIPKELVGNRSRWQYIQGLEKSPPSTPTSGSVSKALRDLEALRRRLSFQSGTKITQALRSLKWKTH